MLAFRTFVFCVFCLFVASNIYAQGTSAESVNLDLRELEKVVDIFGLRDGVLITKDRFVADLVRVKLDNAIGAINARQRQYSKHAAPEFRYALTMAKRQNSELLHYVFALHTTDLQLANAVQGAELLPKFCLFTGHYGECAGTAYFSLHRSYQRSRDWKWKNISTRLLAEFSQTAIVTFPLQGSNLGRITFRKMDGARQTFRRGAYVHMHQSGQTAFFCRPLFFIEHKRGEESCLAAVRVEYFERPAGMTELVYLGNDETNGSFFEQDLAFLKLGLRELTGKEMIEEQENSRNSTAKWAAERAFGFSEFLDERIGEH